MSRRCKPGQRARIVCDCSDRGAIVVVVRAYRGELVNNATWPKPLFPWVITSLGAPIGWTTTTDPSKQGTAYTIVVDDSDLEPINDDDSGETQSTRADQPRAVQS